MALLFSSPFKASDKSISSSPLNRSSNTSILNDSVLLNTSKKVRLFNITNTLSPILKSSKLRLSLNDDVEEEQDKENTSFNIKPYNTSSNDIIKKRSSSILFDSPKNIDNSSPIMRNKKDIFASSPIVDVELDNSNTNISLDKSFESMHPLIIDLQNHSFQIDSLTTAVSKLQEQNYFRVPVSAMKPPGICVSMKPLSNIKGPIKPFTGTSVTHLRRATTGGSSTSVIDNMDFLSCTQNFIPEDIEIMDIPFDFSSIIDSKTTPIADQLGRFSIDQEKIELDTSINQNLFPGPSSLPSSPLNVSQLQRCRSESTTQSPVNKMDECAKFIELMDAAPLLVLPTMKKQGDNKYTTSRISCDTMAELLNGKFKDVLDYYLIVDCRYDYEYTAGHIKGAVCINRKELLKKFYTLNNSIKANVGLIFHCEYSKNRGPRAADFFRALDRASNNYPALTFPNIYIMDSGYREFYVQYPELCKGGFTSMWDPAFTKQCKLWDNLSKLSWHAEKKNNYKKRKSMISSINKLKDFCN